MARPYRRSDFDVTDTVQVSSPAAVREAVLELYSGTWPGAPLDTLRTALADFERLFTGQMPGYLGVDTVYHDLQHSQDMLLATARLMAGYEKTHADRPRIGWERGLMGLVTALFHDSGYIRAVDEQDIPNGAVFTRQHVTRSARYLGQYLPSVGLGEWVPVSTRIVHFTGYEIPLDLIRVADARDRLVGHLLGTADMLAQMADRCYLEKCRDRLYAEFVLGDVAVHAGAGGMKVLYGSGLDLLRQTPRFVATTLENRLGKTFGHAYRHLEPLFGGGNPYMDAIRQNVDYLRGLARSGRWPLLRRNPPVFTVLQNPMQGVRVLLITHLKELWGAPPAVSVH
ncbi:MAG TPA: hypothetical protein VI339_02265 [Steroidobacteraceae bacterium]|nr:hypothetical protein [Steroidobacteraceae bacterium]